MSARRCGAGGRTTVSIHSPPAGGEWMLTVVLPPAPHRRADTEPLELIPLG